MPNRPRLNATYLPLRAHQSVLASPPCLTTPRRGHLERHWCPPRSFEFETRGGLVQAKGPVALALGGQSVRTRALASALRCPQLPSLGLHLARCNRCLGLPPLASTRIHHPALAQGGQVLIKLENCPENFFFFSFSFSATTVERGLGRFSANSSKMPHSFRTCSVGQLKCKTSSNSECPMDAKKEKFS